MAGIRSGIRGPRFSGAERTRSQGSVLIGRGKGRMRCQTPPPVFARQDTVWRPETRPPLPRCHGVVRDTVWPIARIPCAQRFPLPSPTRSAAMTDQLATLLTEDRRFPPSARFVSPPWPLPPSIRPPAGPAGLLGEQARDAGLDQPWHTGARVEACPTPSGSSGGQLNVAANCLDRHLKGAAPQQGRDHLGGRAGRPPDPDLLGAGSRGRPRRQRPPVPRREEGRPGRDLPPDDPRSRHRHAGLRPDRRHPLGGLRRLLGGGAARPDQRRRGDRPDHRRRRLSPRAGPAAQAHGRRGPRRVPEHPARGGGAPPHPGPAAATSPSPT